MFHKIRGYCKVGIFRGHPYSGLILKPFWMWKGVHKVWNAKPKKEHYGYMGTEHGWFLEVAIFLLAWDSHKKHLKRKSAKKEPPPTPPPGGGSVLRFFSVFGGYVKILSILEVYIWSDTLLLSQETGHQISWVDTQLILAAGLGFNFFHHHLLRNVVLWASGQRCRFTPWR